MSIQNLIAKHHASTETQAQSTTAGAGIDPNRSDKIIRYSENNIYRYNGSYSGGEYSDTEDYFANLIWEIFPQTSAYKELVEAVKKNGNIDIYFVFDYFGGPTTNPVTGEETPGTNGRTKPLVAEDIKGPQNHLLRLPEPIMKKAKEGAELGRNPLVITINTSYILSLFYIVNNLPKSADNLNKFAFVMERAVFTYMHEVNAHAINSINGIELSGEVEHGIYNSDQRISDSSPMYIAIPIDGKTPASKDKIEIQRIIKRYKKKWSQN